MNMPRKHFAILGMVVMSCLLILQTLLPPFLSRGWMLCLLFLLLMSTLIYRLNTIHEQYHK